MSTNGRYVVHDLDDGDSNNHDDEQVVFDVMDTIAALIIDCTGTFSIQEHDGRGEAYVGHCGISIALYELTSQWCVPVPNAVPIPDHQRTTLEANKFPDWRKHFTDHLDLTNFSRRRYTYLEGQSAYFVLRAIMTGGADGVAELDRIGRAVVLQAPADDCELLYGRAGFLHGLLLLRRRLGQPDLFADLITRLVQQVLDNGLHGEVLLWTWHGKQYLGAVHGVAGVCYVLLCCAAEAVACYDNFFWLLANTVDRVLGTYAHPQTTTPMPTPTPTPTPPDADRSSSGGGGGSGDAAMCNVFSTAREGGSDERVHFCHGATGWVPLLLLMSVAYEARNAAQVRAYLAPPISPPHATLTSSTM